MKREKCAVKRALSAVLSAVFAAFLLAGLMGGKAAAAPEPKAAVRKQIVCTDAGIVSEPTGAEAKELQRRLRAADEEMMKHVDSIYMPPKRMGDMSFFFPKEVREAQRGKVYRNTYHIDLDGEGNPTMIYTSTDEEAEALDAHVMSALWDTSYVPARTMSGKTVPSTLSLDMFFAFRPDESSLQVEKEAYKAFKDMRPEESASPVRFSAESMKGLMREFYTRAPREDFFSVFLLQVDDAGAVKSARVVVRAEDEEMMKVFNPHIFDRLLAWKFAPVPDAKGDADMRMVPVYVYVPAASEEEMPDILWLEYFSLWEQKHKAVRF
ncbi:hypothetical protein [Selenomonas sp. TAMA-11512]|uniref:hypothetical protein n=1 Tax=Selenomonas sp. TAMA-11512 TaxID=3095337 RepID=UPI0030D3D3CD